ncbi:MAG: enoyl-CoA hydratase/isomerase family protein [Chloroflexota bacterium]|nr:enoyl-CoA hydratase/isomerase family protein [Chloroflexota bacterium]
MSESRVLVERRGNVGLVTLNRPAKLNALNTQLMDELERAVGDLDADRDIGAIVLTGAGERAFSAGGDMAEQVEAIEGRRPPRRGSPSAGVRGCRTPTIAAVRGYCYGGGALLAISCDIRVSGHDGRFKFHGASYGRALGGALLPRIVGAAKAKELLFTGDEVPAAEAARIGLVNQVVESADVVDYAVAMAQRIASNSSPAVQGIKDTIDLALPIERAEAFEKQLNADLAHSADSTARFRRAAARVLGGSHTR